MYVSSEQQLGGGNISQLAAKVEIPNALGGKLVARALEQDWSLSQHMRFVARLGEVVGNAFNMTLQLAPDGDRVDYEPEPFTLKTKVDLACTEPGALAIFDRALEAESDPSDTVTALELKTAEQEAKQICHGCGARDICLEQTLSLQYSPPGVWGGMTQEERQAIRKSLIPDLAIVRDLYATAADQLATIGDSAQNERAAHRKTEPGIAVLWQEFFPEVERRPERSNKFHMRYAEVVAHLQGNLVAAERTPLLVNNLGRAVLSTWLAAAQFGGPSQYNYQDLSRKNNTSANSIKKNRIQASENAVVGTVLGLVEHTFDYAEWQQGPAVGCQKSVLSFLARLGAPISPTAGLDNLKEQANQIVGLVNPNSGRVAVWSKNLLRDYYALGDEPPVNVQELARRHGKTDAQINAALRKKIDNLRLKL